MSDRLTPCLHCAAESEVEIDEPYLENWSMTAVVDVNATNVTPNELREHAKKSLQQPAPGKKRRTKRRRLNIDGDGEAVGESDSDADFSDSSDESDAESESDAAMAVVDPPLPVHTPPRPARTNRSVLVFPRTSTFAPDAREADFWQGAFPALFPWGVGVPCQRTLHLNNLEGPLTIKKTRISLKEHGHSLLRQYESDCRLHPHFMFVLFNHLQKVEAFSRSFLGTTRAKRATDSRAG